MANGMTFPRLEPASALRRATRQRGSFLLEALISVLIVAFGILGLIGLQARAIQNVDDAQYRGEATYLANAYLGQMWVADRTTLNANFDDASGGPAYAEFKAWVGQRLPGAIGNDPKVTITPAGSRPPARPSTSPSSGCRRGNPRPHRLTNTTWSPPSARTHDGATTIPPSTARSAPVWSRR